MYIDLLNGEEEETTQAVTRIAGDNEHRLGTYLDRAEVTNVGRRDCSDTAHCVCSRTGSGMSFPLHMHFLQNGAFLHTGQK